MSSANCSIQIAPGHGIRISSLLLKTLGIGKPRQISLKFGSKLITSDLVLTHRQGHSLRLSSALSNELKLPHAGKCLVTKRGDNEIQIGPLIGILAGRTKHGGISFGGMSGFFKQQISAGEGKSYSFAFSPKDVNWEEETVTGYFPQKTGGWIRRKLPLPDVVYNRMQSRQAERVTSMGSFKERFLRRSIPLFNWSFFDKSDVYKLLVDDPLAKHIPESHLSPSAITMKEMLNKYGTVYLKPSGGSLGVGIYKLIRHREHRYTVRYRSHGQNRVVHYTSADRMLNMLMKHQRSRFHQYIAQQGIDLIQVDSCPVDFRFHMTKDGENQWVVAAIGAKKAGKGSITTHVASGGKLLATEQVFRQAFGGEAPQMLRKVRSTAVDLARAIERNYPYLLGEIGFDLGIDRSGKVWMFEANAKPGRSIFKHPTAKSGERASLDNLIDYCKYLSKF
ncbi:YheC/YheD family protein [Paenibacillus terrigena]|uniref:YheC/YheD family endospore coat-associated protein n=1 Tax=Paenibacillus terrigena TaxID=369333 RepID=UPI000377A236|nr:YheC/YheD family protein [Paenibacillus terrigena]